MGWYNSGNWEGLTLDHLPYIMAACCNGVRKRLIIAYKGSTAYGYKYFKPDGITTTDYITPSDWVDVPRSSPLIQQNYWRAVQNINLISNDLSREFYNGSSIYINVVNTTQELAGGDTLHITSYNTNAPAFPAVTIPSSIGIISNLTPWLRIKDWCNQRRYDIGGGALLGGVLDDGEGMYSMYSLLWDAFPDPVPWSVINDFVDAAQAITWAGGVVSDPAFNVEYDFEDDPSYYFNETHGSTPFSITNGLYSWYMSDRLDSRNGTQRLNSSPLLNTPYSYGSPVDAVVEFSDCYATGTNFPRSISVGGSSYTVPSNKDRYVGDTDIYRTTNYISDISVSGSYTASYDPTGDPFNASLKGISVIFLLDFQSELSESLP